MTDDNSIFDKMIEMGMGMTMANQIPRMMNSVMPNPQEQVPPPIASSSIQFYAVINGNQVGPLVESEVIALIQKGLITNETLVWKAGMTSWMQASQIPEIGKLLLLHSSK